MSRIFAYVRVSTVDQTVENQIHEIEAAGFGVEPHRIVAETVSGNVAASQRVEFQRLLDRLEPGDTLVVSKIDRLGRNMFDVASTIDTLKAAGVKLHCLALAGTDLTSSSGTLIMTVIAAIAQFERDQLVERTQAGLARAKSDGKRLGRPPALTDDQREDLCADLATGASVASLSRKYKVSRATVLRVREAETMSG